MQKKPTNLNYFTALLLKDLPKDDIEEGFEKLGEMLEHAIYTRLKARYADDYEQAHTSSINKTDDAIESIHGDNIAVIERGIRSGSPMTQSQLYMYVEHIQSLVVEVVSPVNEQGLNSTIDELVRSLIAANVLTHNEMATIVVLINRDLASLYDAVSQETEDQVTADIQWLRKMADWENPVTMQGATDAMLHRYGVDMALLAKEKERTQPQMKGPEGRVIHTLFPGKRRR